MPRSRRMPKRDHGPPTPLRELQQQLMHAITRSEAPAAADLVRPSSRLSADARLEIYRSAYYARLVECLVEDYPALQHALGREAFRSLCHAYIEHHPSRSPSLNGFGRQMAAFCAQRALPDAACLAELAQLEWSIVELIHAPQSVALDATALVSLTPDQFGHVRLRACPSVRLLDQAYPVNAYYDDFLQGTARALPPAAVSCTLLRRPGLKVIREALDPARAPLLRALLSGAPIATALNDAAASGALPEHVQAAFAYAFGAGLFTALEPL